MLDQEISRLKKSLDATQTQLDAIKAEKKNLAHEVTESAAKIASLKDELVDEKLKHEHSSSDLQAQLHEETKRRKVIEERLANLRSRYEKSVANGRIAIENKGDGVVGNAFDTEHQTESQQGIEVETCLPAYFLYLFNIFKCYLKSC